MKQLIEINNAHSHFINCFSFSFWMSWVLNSIGCCEYFFIRPRYMLAAFLFCRTYWIQSPDGVVQFLIGTNIAVFFLWRIADPLFMRKHFMVSFSTIALVLSMYHFHVFQWFYLILVVLLARPVQLFWCCSSMCLCTDLLVIDEQISLDNFRSGRLHTLLTSAFSHSDLDHLVTNMIGLYFFGLNVRSFLPWHIFHAETFFFPCFW